jgi:hypothetical protein
MPILRIQHAVPSFEAWKRAFDSDPVGRKAGGVVRHTVYRVLGDPTLVVIDLEFRAVSEAERFLAKLRALWAGPGGAVMRNPAAWILEPVDA